MKAWLLAWAPAALLAAGTAMTLGIDRQQKLDVREPLESAVPVLMSGYQGKDIKLSDEEIRVAGMSRYLMRSFARPATGAQAGAPAGFSIYVGYYDQQTQGRTIHSPKNCLPGSGWEALKSERETLQTAAGDVQVNRYLLKREDEAALVLYWYQGRGRIEANEYVVKWNLLRDAALRSRSDEALVRIVVPITGDTKDELALARAVADELIPAVHGALPN